MASSSGACINCKQRRIKCDKTRPLCNTCEVAHLTCLGYPPPIERLQFRDENKYASGSVPRKQRKPNVLPDKASNPSRDIRESQSGSPAAQESEFSRTRAARTLLPRPLVSNLQRTVVDIPPEDQAITYFAQRYFVPTDTLPDATLWGYLYRYHTDTVRLSQESMLTLAVRSLALAIFHHRRLDQTIFHESRALYIRAIGRVNEALCDPEKSKSDEVLAAVMVLSNYEGAVGRSAGSSTFENGLRHQEGVIAMLQTRMDRQRQNVASKELEKVVRAQLVRFAVLRARPLPIWLQNPSPEEYQGPEVELDQCLVQLASIRHQIREMQTSNVPPTVITQQELLANLQYLDQKLLGWRQSLPQTWNYQVQHVPDSWLSASGGHDRLSVAYKPTIHVYFDILQASLYNRYRAARTITNSAMLLLTKTAPDTPFGVATAYADNVRNLTDAICATVPYHLGLVGSSEEQLKVMGVQGGDFIVAPEVERSVNAPVAYLLMWPLLIVVGLPVVPVHQKRWIGRQLHLISKIVGSKELEMIVQDHQSSHSP